MNKLKKQLLRHGWLPWRIAGGYLASLAAFAAFLYLFLMFCEIFFGSFTWYGNELLYPLLHFASQHLDVLIILTLLLGWTVITYIYVTIPLRYMDKVASAAKQMAAEPERPVTLPAAIHDVQDELNLVRERSVRNAAAAREAEQRKNDLIVYLAHDLKTPLTSVIGYLTLLKDEAEISPALRDRYTGVALAKAERLEELINEFFDITRFNLTEIRLELETVSLTRLLEQTAFEFEPALQEKNLRWKLALEPDVDLLCDPEKLSRVFDNLFRNAVSYSYPDTEIALTMKRDGEKILVTVRNSGRTIPPEKLARLFEQFFRLDASRSSAGGGAGLGLAIAKELVEKHGGSIRAESAEESILFTVELPAKGALCQPAPRERS